jgi:methylated-DNA-[protein]-cysteine S-methyltransferase
VAGLYCVQLVAEMGCAAMTFQLEEFDSPIGGILLVSGGGCVRALEFCGFESRLNRLLTAHWGEAPAFRAEQPTDFRRRVSDYFAGDLQALDTLPVATSGTAFQESVWRALRQIPVGHTWSYGQLAAHIGKPRAMRAAGHANSLKPSGDYRPLPPRNRGELFTDGLCGWDRAEAVVVAARRCETVIGRPILAAGAFQAAPL